MGVLHVLNAPISVINSRQNIGKLRGWDYQGDYKFWLDNSLCLWQVLASSNTPITPNAHAANFKMDNGPQCHEKKESGVEKTLTLS